MRWPLSIVVLLGSCTAPNPSFGLDPTEAAASGSVTTSDGSGEGPSSTTTQGNDSVASGEGDGGSSDSGGAETTGGEVKPPDVSGTTWWLCEHGVGGLPPPDHCAMVDDNGLQFRPEPYVDQVWWAAAPDIGCEGAPGRCFPADTPNPGPFDSAEWGKWSIDIQTVEAGTHVLLTVGACLGSLWFQHVPGEPYVKVTPGDGGACGAIGLDEPGIAPAGPWFMRQLP